MMMKDTPRGGAPETTFKKTAQPNKTERAFVKLEASVLRQQYEARKANTKATKTTLIF
jgi:hypothetical protein